MKCVDCGLNEAVKGDDLCEECRSGIEAISSLTYRIPWRKYDPENPPSTDVDYIVYSVDDAYERPLPWIAKFNGEYWEDDYYTVISDVTHYAPINLPGEG